MRAGRLRHRVTLQTRSTAKDAYGHPVQSSSGWTNVSTHWARIQPLNGTERNTADLVKGGISHLVTVRASTAFNPSRRLLFGSRIFNIESALQMDEIDHEMQIACKETV